MPTYSDQADIQLSAPAPWPRDDRFDDLVRRVRAEYLEMPGLRLSATQAQRLWCLDAERCLAVLEDLLVDRFLACSSTGNYRRFDLA